MDSLLQSSPSVGPSMTNGSQNMAMVPLVQEHSLAAVSHQESFDLGMFTADEVLFGGEFDEMYIHTIDESLFAGTVGPSFLPSTAPFYMTSPTHQIQLQQHGHPQEQPQRYQSQQHQHNHGPSYCHPDDLHQTLSRDTFMTSPGPQQPGCSNHHPTSPSHYPHFSMQLFQQNIPYIGSIHGLIEIRPVGMEMLQHRAPVVERLSSPDGSMSPNSDHGYMDSMTDDEPSSSSYSSYNSLSSLADDHIASPLSQLSVSCDPLEEMIPRSPLHPAQASQVPQLDYSHMTMDPSIASPMISPTSKRTPQSSPLKQHFSSFSDSEGPEEDESQLQGKPRKRVRRPHVKKAPQQPKLMTKLPVSHTHTRVMFVFIYRFPSS